MIIETAVNNKTQAQIWRYWNNNKIKYQLSYPNFVWGLSFVDLLILVNRLTVLNASYSAKQMIIQCFDQEYERYRKGGAKGSLQGVFWTLARPG